jgi:quinohemoprotein ethanol dehydrogenase
LKQITNACAFFVLTAALMRMTIAQEQVHDGTLSAEQDGRNWAGYGRTFSENHYSPLSMINTATVGRLSLAWYHDLDTGQRTDSQPLAVDGVIYVATGLSIVQALDARTGQVRWRYDPQVGKVAGAKLRASWGIRGLALWGNRVYVGTQDGRLLALDSKSGALEWSVATLDKNDETTITGAPRAFNGKVLIGFAGGDRSGTRGAVTCYDAATGKQLWRFYTVPGDPSKGFANDAMRMAAKTWSGRWWKNGGGAAVWNAMTYDPDFNRVYIGTGNADPWNPSIRNPGKKDNLFAASVVALDANTGEYIWHYQENPNEGWDYDSSMDMELASLPIGGRLRKVLLHAPKNGFLYVLDRTNGRLISAQKLGTITWAKRIDLRTGRPLEYSGIRYEKKPILIWPGYDGLHNWPPMSFSPYERLLFIPAINKANYYNMGGIDPRAWTPTKNSWTTGLGEEVENNTARGRFSSSLLAWNPITQKKVWTAPTTGLWAGGTMATAGGLVFQGQLDGTFNAYNMLNGRKLWSFDAGVAVTGAPITFIADGTQYITVLAGPFAGAAANQFDVDPHRDAYRDPRRVLTFAIGGKATLPVERPPSPVVPIVGGPPPDPDMERAGADLFGSNCTNCHGSGAVAGGNAPDLRTSSAVFSTDAFANVVRYGARVAAGMPQFDEFSTADLEALRAYIRSRANAKSPVPESINGP